MQQTKIGTLVWAALIAAPIGWSIGRVYEAVAEALPPVPWVLAVLLVFLAVLAIVGERAVRAWIGERRFDAQLDPLRVARMVVLAKAGALFGAAIAGAYLGLAVLSLGWLAVPMGRDRLLLSAFVVLAAVIVAVASVRLERACMVPPDDDGDDGSNGSGGRNGSGGPSPA